MTCDDPFFEGVDVRSHEGRPEGCHFIKYAAHGPNVTLTVVRQIRPHFRTGIVWSSSLGTSESALANFADIKVT